MVNKVFSIYSRGKESYAGNKQLIVEVGLNHIACMVKEESRKTIEDFELFKTDENEEIKFEQLFSQVVAGSALLEKTYTKTTVYINHEAALIMPSEIFNNDDSNDYLNLVFGDADKAAVLIDDVNTEAGFVTVYRVYSSVSEVLHNKFENLLIEHTYSKILERLYRNNAVWPELLMKVQFYYQHFILVFVSGKKLQLIQTFRYTTTEDVVYHILNICRQFDIQEKQLLLEASGIIDPGTALYSGLKNYFGQIVIQHEDAGDEKPNAKQSPAYYFTPVFNLAE